MGVSIWEGNKAERVASALELIAIAQAGTISVLTGEAIKQIVRSGLAAKAFSIGQQVDTTFNPDGSTTQYDMPLDMVSFADAVNADGETVPALWLESHWALPGVQFDASEAIWYCNEALPAGTYYFTFGNNWGTHVVANKSYQFTLETGLDVGGQIVVGTASSFYTWAAPDQNPTNWRVYTFANAKSITPVEGPLTLTEGTSGTSLGTMSSSTKYGTTGLNNLQRCAYGYNRWSQSGIRQWMNSAAPAGEWWEPKNVYDRPPQQLATMRGMLAGIPSDILDVVQPVQVVTALNTVSDSEIGTTETTVDKFFLASLEQEYIVPQLANVEGPYWPYWKDRLGLTSPQAQGSAGTNANHIRYDIANHTSAQTVRLRSAYRGYASYTWYVGTSGHASTTTATHAYRPCPACVIC